jgi:hypothetical protein
VMFTALVQLKGDENSILSLLHVGLPLSSHSSPFRRFRAQAHTMWALACALLLTLASPPVGAQTVMCGPGTFLSNGVCVIGAGKPALHVHNTHL